MFTAFVVCALCASAASCDSCVCIILSRCGGNDDDDACWVEVGGDCGLGGGLCPSGGGVGRTCGANYVGLDLVVVKGYIGKGLGPNPHLGQ